MKQKHVRLKHFQSKISTRNKNKKPFSHLGDPVLMTTQASNMGPSDVPP